MRGVTRVASVVVCAQVEAHRQEHGLATLTSKLSGWKVAKTMVFLKYWQLDLLNSLTHPFDVAALKIQTQFRMFNARRKFLPMKMKYADVSDGVAPLCLR